MSSSASDGLSLFDVTSDESQRVTESRGGHNHCSPVSTHSINSLQITVCLCQASQWSTYFMRFRLYGPRGSYFMSRLWIPGIFTRDQQPGGSVITSDRLDDWSTPWFNDIRCQVPAIKTTYWSLMYIRFAVRIQMNEKMIIIQVLNEQFCLITLIKWTFLLVPQIIPSHTWWIINILIISFLRVSVFIPACPPRLDTCNHFNAIIIFPSNIFFLNPIKIPLCHLYTRTSFR